jgi:Na+/H+-translocating membrane pyrophosphatase
MAQILMVPHDFLMEVNSFTRIQGMSNLLFSNFIINIVICIVFAFMQGLKVKQRKSHLGYIGCCIGLFISMVAPFISYITTDPNLAIWPIHYSLTEMLLMMIIINIPTIILLGITFISNYRYRNTVSQDVQHLENAQ